MRKISKLDKKLSRLSLSKFFCLLWIFLSLIWTIFLPTTVVAEEVLAQQVREVYISLPKTFKESLSAPRYGNQGIGYGCDRNEIVKTCDANTSMSMPKSGFWGSELVLGPAVNRALLGLKMKTKCKTFKTLDSSGIHGCVYQGCIGYSKPVVMSCVPRGSKL